MHVCVCVGRYYIQYQVQSTTTSSREMRAVMTQFPITFKMSPPIFRNYGVQNLPVQLFYVIIIYFILQESGEEETWNFLFFIFEAGRHVATYNVSFQLQTTRSTQQELIAT